MIHSLYLGRVDYGEALRLQQELVSLRHEERIANTLLLLEHPPVLTLGRNASRANVLASDDLLASRGVTLHLINRGGDVTYHGPGQLIGYPIFDLRSLRNPSGARMGPVDFVRQIEEALIGLCAEFSIPAGRICGLTGVWCGLGPADSSLSDQSCAQRTAQRTAQDPPQGERKIGAIGIHVSRGITSHGFAFNVTTNLAGFALINPCGIVDRPVTSLEKEVRAAQPLPDLEAMAHKAAQQFGKVFNQPIQRIESLTGLRAQVASTTPQFPAEDTPLQIPAEIDRLLHIKTPPQSA